MLWSKYKALGEAKKKVEVRGLRLGFFKVEVRGLLRLEVRGFSKLRFEV